MEESISAVCPCCNARVAVSAKHAEAYDRAVKAFRFMRTLALADHYEINPDCMWQQRKGLASVKMARTICTFVGDFYHYSQEELFSRRRPQHLSFVRQVAMYLCRKLTKGSFPEIGALFGRDHSTVIHAYNLIARRHETDLRKELDKLEAIIAGHLQTIEQTAA